MPFLASCFAAIALSLNFKMALSLLSLIMISTAVGPNWSELFFASTWCTGLTGMFGHPTFLTLTCFQEPIWRLVEGNWTALHDRADRRSRWEQMAALPNYLWCASPACSAIWLLLCMLTEPIIHQSSALHSTCDLYAPSIASGYHRWTCESEMPGRNFGGTRLNSAHRGDFQHIWLCTYNTCICV